MRKSKRFTALALVAGLAVALSACGSDKKTAATTTVPSSGSTTPTGSTPSGGKCTAGTVKVDPIPDLKADGKGKSVGLLFDVTGRGDKSFNDGAAAGLDKAKKDFGISGVESMPTASDGSDRADRLKQVADGASNLIVAVGFLWDAGVAAGAVAYPNKHFAIIDDVPVNNNGTPNDATDDKPFDNVRAMTFAEEQGSFLVGVAAACASKSGKIGFIGGVQIPLIQKFEAGFRAGVKYINPSASVDVKYITQPPDFTGFNDPTKGKATGAAMYASGIDVVYAAAGGSGKGLFEAAKDAGKPGDVWAIGVDSDQYLSVDASQQPYILTSMLKRVDVATYEAIAAELNGQFKGEHITYDLKAAGVGYSGSNSAINAYAGTIEQAKADIISGKIVVPTDPTKV